MFCILLFNSVSYVFFIVMFMYSYCLYALFCIFCFHHANWHSLTTLTEDFPCFFLSWQMPGYNLQRWGVVHTLPNCVVLCIVCVDCVVLCTVCV